MKNSVSKLGIFRKLGMSRIFNDKGKAIPITVLKLEKSAVINPDETNPNFIVAFYTKNKINQATQGALKKNKIEDKFSKFISFRKTDKFNFKNGDELKIDQFSPGEKVYAVSTSKGKGFSGVIKRHSFSRGPETHGSQHHRSPGSIGSMFPQRVVAGKKMPGRMGATKTTIKNLTIIDKDEKNNLLVVSGSVAGPNKCLVYILQ
ncbi:MAG: large subunit ribosomal protein L3 [Candidatus Berkelbacteria bacterium Licking1014_7]|uniref:50S ribosomal protein L3 n=1 Tax=Candidatus Berkelbacteria bacterium Licking1014_7 TaxID=2017147 RepID=A0A554LKM4_9BACT|nr:MAG: large subunit ribosomal protein L3 [Candidatus Berkelbacteria bacterium Licking1014_7]